MFELLDAFKSRSAKSFFKYNGYAAAPIIAALSVQYIKSGKSKCALYFSHNLAISLLRYLFADTPPATTTFLMS